MPCVVVVSDTHVGSTLGLWPEGFQVEEGAVVQLNKFQKWLLDCWWQMLGDIMELPEKPIVVVNGDVIQGAHEKDAQLVTTRIDLQAAAALEILKPLRELASSMYMLHGTAWHGGPASSHVSGVAKALECVPEPTTGRPCWWELYLRLGERLAHFTHHVSATSLPMYEASIPLRDSIVLNSELSRVYGADAPRVDLDVRAHRHRCILTFKPPRTWVAVSPSWQLKGEFVFKVAASSLPDIGYLLIECNERDLVVLPRLFQLPALHIEIAA
jgi:hypothetical protein